jgi:hypothetical protein
MAATLCYEGKYTRFRKAKQGQSPSGFPVTPGLRMKIPFRP